MSRADIVLFVLALTLLPLLYQQFWQLGERGDTAEIQVGGKPYAVMDLHNNQTLAVAGRLGDSVLEVHDGEVRFRTSPCRGNHCVHSGWLRIGGEFAACLPNAVSLRVKAADPRFDSINF